MKLLVFCLLILITFACNNHKSNPQDPATPAQAETGKLADSEGEAQLEKQLEELQKLSPYTLDQMKAMLPAQLSGVPFKTATAKNNMGTAFSEAEYVLNDSMSVSLNIFDCAGQAGAGIYHMQYWVALKTPAETEGRYTRIMDFKSSKAIEQADAAFDRSTFTWFSGNRLLITLEGLNTGPDLLKQVASGLILK